MTLLELARKRYSVRKYTDEPVSEEDLDYLKECVRLAPSAVNFQPWKFVFIRSEKAKADIRQTYPRRWFESAPMYVLCLMDREACWKRPCDGKAHGDIDLAIAIEHLCLAAADRGLGTCWVCNYDSAKMQELFPYEGYEAVAIVSLGHIAPDCPCNEKNRKPASEIFETC